MKKEKRELNVNIEKSSLASLIVSSVNLNTIEEEKPLVWAAKNGNSYILNLIIEDEHDLSDDGYDALLAAIDSNNIDIVKILIKNDVKVTDRNNEAIILASERGFSKIVKLLIDYGADTTACDFKAFYLACVNNHLDVVKILYENGCNFETEIVFALDKTIRHGYYDITKYLLSLLNQDINNYYPLKSSFEKAVTENHFNIVELLIDKGMDINSAIFGTPPLLYAASSGSTESAKLLIDAGANLSYDNFIVLWLAAKNDHKEIFNMIVKKLQVK